MARIEWVLVCDQAFFDRHGRLCTVGIASRLTIPSLPVLIRQLMVVARLTVPHLGEEIGIGVAIVTPTGTWAVPDDPDGVQIEVAEEYVLMTVRDLPMMEQGTYRFEVYLDEQTMSVEVPVRVVPRQSYAEVH